MQDQPFEFNDKAMHALYFLGGSLLLGGYGVARGSWPRRWWLLPLVAAVVGAFDETHQRFTPGRSVEFADWIADTLGGLLAVPATFVWRDVRDRWLRFVRKKAGVTAPPSAG